MTVTGAGEQLPLETGHSSPRASEWSLSLFPSLTSSPQPLDFETPGCLIETIKLDCLQGMGVKAAAFS